MMKLNWCGAWAAATVSLVYGNVSCVAQPGIKPSGQVRVVDSPLQDTPVHPSHSLDEALAAFRQQLLRDHQEQFSPLLTKQSVLMALRVNLKYYECHKPDLQGSFPGRNYKQNLDLMRQIASGGPWPHGAWLSGFYTLTDAKGVTYQGIGVRLDIRDPQHPSQQLVGSSWPILDVWYGHCE